MRNRIALGHTGLDVEANGNRVCRRAADGEQAQDDAEASSDERELEVTGHGEFLRMETRDRIMQPLRTSDAPERLQVSRPAPSRISRAARRSADV
jgi:hypothetical protein